MSFLKRLYYFSTGLIIGIVFLFFILNGKRTSCNYGPSARVIDNIISKELILKYQTDSIVDDKLYNLISEGRVRFNKSEISNEPCPIYFVESGDSSLLIENCDRMIKDCAKLLSSGYNKPGQQCLDPQNLPTEEGLVDDFLFPP